MGDKSKAEKAQKTLFNDDIPPVKQEPEPPVQEITPVVKQEPEPPVKPVTTEPTTVALYTKEEQQTVTNVMNANNGKMKYQVERLSKDRQDKRDAWMILKEQYPELKELKDLSNYAVALTKAVSKKLDIPMTGIDILGGKPYINKTGLFCKLNKIKKKEFTSKPLILPLDMNMETIPDEMKPVIGFSKDGTCVFQSTIILAHGTKYTSHGTANAKYLCKEYNKMSTMIPYVIELAETRSENRCIRKATGVGLCSVEEINEQVDMASNFFKKMENKQFASEAIEEDREEERLEKIKMINNILDNRGYNEAKKKAVFAVHGNTNIGLLPIKAIDLIYESLTKDNVDSSNEQKKEITISEKKERPTLIELLNKAEKIRQDKKIPLDKFNEITAKVKGDKKDFTIDNIFKIIQLLNDYKPEKKAGESKKKGADKKDGKTETKKPDNSKS